MSFFFFNKKKTSHASRDFCVLQAKPYVGSLRVERDENASWCFIFDCVHRKNRVTMTMWSSNKELMVCEKTFRFNDQIIS